MTGGLRSFLCSSPGCICVLWFSTKVVPDSVQIQIWISKSEVLEKHTVQIVIIVLTGMPQLGIKFLIPCFYTIKGKKKMQPVCKGNGCPVQYIWPRANAIHMMALIF